VTTGRHPRRCAARSPPSVPAGRKRADLDGWPARSAGSGLALWSWPNSLSERIQVPLCSGSDRSIFEPCGIARDTGPGVGTARTWRTTSRAGVARTWRASRCSVLVIAEVLRESAWPGSPSVRPVKRSGSYRRARCCDQIHRGQQRRRPRRHVDRLRGSTSRRLPGSAPRRLRGSASRRLPAGEDRGVYHRRGVHLWRTASRIRLSRSVSPVGLPVSSCPLGRTSGHLRGGAVLLAAVPRASAAARWPTIRW
jgi:hypothetical protein